MAYRAIIREGDPVLRKHARPVEVFDERLWTLLDDMTETMTRAKGVGLAAPQVGVLRRVVVVDGDDGPIELINPVITHKSGRQEEVEGCLSCPGEAGVTRRPKRVTVQAQDRFGQPFTLQGEDLLARAFCHEIDHLDGILYKDHAIRMLEPEEIQQR